VIRNANTKNNSLCKARSCRIPFASRLSFKKAQSILEYTIVLGVIVIIMFAMGPMVKRGAQSMIKLVADQVGVQNNAEQRFDESGHLDSSYTATRGSMDKQTLEYLGTTRYVFDDTISTQSNAHMNLGFTEER